MQKEGAALVRGSNRQLSFGGERSVSVRAGGTLLSDPLPGRLPAATSLVVSLYVAEAGGPATGHGMAMQTSYTAWGDHAAEEGPDDWTGTTGSWLYLDAVTVRTGPDIGAVVALGDSITDGWQSTTDRNRRWPDHLARRLRADPDTDIEGVANEGISGNKVLADGSGQSALNRLHRDVFSHPGVRTVLLFEGVNDIKAHTGVAAGDLTDGYRRIIDRAHAAGVCVVGRRSGRSRAGTSGTRRPRAYGRRSTRSSAPAARSMPWRTSTASCAAPTTTSGSCRSSTTAITCTPTTPV